MAGVCSAMASCLGSCARVLCRVQTPRQRLWTAWILMAVRGSTHARAPLARTARCGLQLTRLPPRAFNFVRAVARRRSRTP